MPVKAVSRMAGIGRALQGGIHRTLTFVGKVRDIVGLYMNPPEDALVLCVDEKSQVQALDRTQPILPLGPGVSDRHTITNGTE
jgi:hypothetical protein